MSLGIQSGRNRGNRRYSNQITAFVLIERVDICGMLSDVLYGPGDVPTRICLLASTSEALADPPHAEAPKDTTAARAAIKVVLIILFMFPSLLNKNQYQEYFQPLALIIKDIKSRNSQFVIWIILNHSNKPVENRHFEPYIIFRYMAACVPCAINS